MGRAVAPGLPELDDDAAVGAPPQALLRERRPVKCSPSDTAGETALPVIPFLCLHLGLSGWRWLSAKTRVNLA
jgi:hypothetical protein